MKLLYLDFNMQYTNPTRNYIPHLMKMLGDVDIYGPGYVSKSVLAKGVKEFYKKHGPYDLIITNEQIVMAPEEIKIYSVDKVYSYYVGHYSFQFPIELVEETVFEMDDFFSSETSPKVLFLLQSDYYYFSEERVRKLENIGAYIVGLGKQFYSKLSDLPFIKKESFFEFCTDEWWRFIEKNDNKIINLPHFVAENEFYFGDIDYRKPKVIVPGVNYFLRKEVINKLKEKDMIAYKNKMYNKVFSLMYRMGIKVFNNPLLINLYNELFRKQIRDFKYAYTCGSGLSIPLRKFFEIPALGTLLLATAFKGARDAGFVDGETYIECDHTNILDKVDWLEANPNEASHIARQGQRMVWEKHSIHARAKQISVCFERILDRSFGGTYWKDGKFYVV